jgi:ABC-type transport system involved in cytochrome bd biosynthesis fused ATPase/permease subunit
MAAVICTLRRMILAASHLAVFALFAATAFLWPSGWFSSKASSWDGQRERGQNHFRFHVILQNSIS